jgi:predicted DNA binding CopG/RHH family protein
MPDSAIDFSDIPESTDSELLKARRVGRPRIGDAKLLIAIRIRTSLLAKIQKTAKEAGKPYQTFIHEILEQKMKNYR